MSHIHPAALERERQRWLRPDWQRWVRPEAHHLFAPTALEEKSRVDEAESDAAFTAELTALRASHDRVRRMLAELKYELAWRRFVRKYSPDQARVPAGSREGGQWTDGGDNASALATVRDGPSVRVLLVDPGRAAGAVISDATPDGVRAWAQYAEAADNRNRDDASVVRTTKILDNTLLAVSTAVLRRPDISPQEFGTTVHVVFARAVREQDLPGIGRAGVEQSFDKEGEARYGKDGSIRTDVVLRNEEKQIIAIYDLKTGNATIRPVRAEELRAMTGAGLDVPVIELHSTRGPARR